MTDKITLMVGMLTELTEVTNPVMWAAAFRRAAANVACGEDLTTDDTAARPITNAVMQRLCHGNATASMVLARYEDRADEKVCLFLKVLTALDTMAAKIGRCRVLLDLAPNAGMTLMVWCRAVRDSAVGSGTEGNWPLCLAVFEKGCTAGQMALLGVRHRSTTDFDGLFEVCQPLTANEVADGAVAATNATTTTTDPAAAAGSSSTKRDMRCYNCNALGHMADRCPKAFTKKSYDYWSKQLNPSPAIKKKLQEYEKLRGKGDVGAAVQTRCKENYEHGKGKDKDQDDDEEFLSFVAWREMTKGRGVNKTESFYAASAGVSSSGSLAKRAGMVNSKPSYSIIFDSGATRSIVSNRLVTGRTFDTEAVRVKYGGGDVEVMAKATRVKVKTVGKIFSCWAYVSERLPFDLLIGEDFMTGRVVLNYVNGSIDVVGDASQAGVAKVIPKFPWGEGKPRAELLHRGSTKEEQDAVLQEELKVLKNIEDAEVRKVVEEYIRKFHEVNKTGWVPCKWEPYEVEFDDPGEGWVPVYDYQYDKEKTEFLSEKLDMWKARGFAVEEESRFASPVVCAAKPQPADEKFRAAVNFRQMNMYTRKSDYKLPTLDEIFKKVKGDVFSTIDGEEGYHKVRIAEKSEKLNALKAIGRTLVIKGMMEGMKNTGSHYQKGSDGMLRRKTEAGVALDNYANGYVDDTIVYSEGMKRHVGHLRDVLERMFVDNVKPKWRKGRFGVTRAVFGGRVVTKKGVELVKEKAAIIRELRRPRGWKDVQKVYGMFLWHKKWISHFDTKAKPITRFLAGEWKHRVIDWDEEAEAAYNQLCDDIEGAVTRCRDGPGVIHIHTDWSKEAVAFHWYREHKGKRFPMGFGGRTMKKTEVNWKAPRGELYAMAYACQELKKECVGREVVLHTDHIAWSELKVESSSDVLVGYLMDILELAPRAVYVKGVLNTVADTITRLLRRIERTQAAVAESRVRVPPAMREEVLREAHEGAIGGHFGKSAMMNIITTKYEPWEGLRREIEDYECAHCDAFKVTKGRYANQAGVWQAYKVDKPWDLVGLDIEETTDTGGTKFYWLYILCFFSKFAEGIVIGAKSSAEVVRALKSSVAWAAGAPRRMTGDDDPAFVRSALFRQFLAEEGVSWVEKDAHHHEGMIERGVATFKHALEAKLAEGAAPRAALRLASGAVNRGHVSTATGATPHSVVYGKEYVTALQRKIEMVSKKADEMRSRAEKYYNRDKVKRVYEVGEKVLVRDPRQKIPRGERKYLGPFRIIKVKGNSVSVLNKFTGRVYRRNVKDLRRTVFGEALEKELEDDYEEFRKAREKTAKEAGKEVEEKAKGASEVTTTPTSPSNKKAAKSDTGNTPTGTDMVVRKPVTSPVKGKKESLSRAFARAGEGLDLVGRRVRVKWDNGNWYYGTVKKRSRRTGATHEIRYDPDEAGENEEPILENLTGDTDKAEWEFVEEG